MVMVQRLRTHLLNTTITLAFFASVLTWSVRWRPRHQHFGQFGLLAKILWSSCKTTVLLCENRTRFLDFSVLAWYCLQSVALTLFAHQARRSNVRRSIPFVYGRRLINYLGLLPLDEDLLQIGQIVDDSVLLLLRGTIWSLGRRLSDTHGMLALRARLSFVDDSTSVVVAADL